MVLFLVGLASIAGAQAGRAGDCEPTRRAEFSVTSMGSVPVVTVGINGAKAEFLFDTGAERTIISTAAAKRLRVDAHYEYARQMRSLGGPVSGGDARLRSFDLGGLALGGFRILVGAVSLPSIQGRPIDGLLGADFLGDYEVDLDLAHRRIILFAAPPCPITAPAWNRPYSTIHANRSLHDRLFFPVQLDGHRLTALIDTGAQLSTLDAESAAALGVTGAELARDPVTTLLGAAAEAVNSRAHRFSELQIDGESLRDQTIVVARLGLQDADLVLGADFLHWQRVWLSYASHQIFIERRL
ncbi:MAG: aspartyl protease family protein [Alphaproteobacteria bacterium]|nr:aspartyl protease family protein [Alphaproteobacteria bacterium]